MSVSLLYTSLLQYCLLLCYIKYLEMELRISLVNHICPQVAHVQHLYGTLLVLLLHEFGLLYKEGYIGMF